MPAILLFLLAALPECADRVREVTRTKGLAAFWDFVKRDASGRFVAHDGSFPLDVVNIPREYWNDGRAAEYGDLPLLGSGPFGQAVRFAAGAPPDLRPALIVPRERLHGSRLDVKGPGRSVSMLAWIKRESGSHAIAGIWHEGTDISPAGDRAARIEPGRRQYALFAGLAANPGGVSAHVSENGRSSFGDRYARNLSVTPEKLPEEWALAGFVFDNRRNTVTSYLNGRATENWLPNPANHPFYSYPYKGWVQGRLARIPGMQPGEDPAYPKDQYYEPPERKPRNMQRISDSGGEKVVVRTYEFTKVRTVYRRGAAVEEDLIALKVNPFWFAHDLYAPAAAQEGGPFTIGRVIHSRRGDGMAGWYGGVAVFDRALSAREIERLGRVGVGSPCAAR